MDRQAYNSCMSPYIKGKGKAKEQRKTDFCIGAKVCSGKAPNAEEAAKICALPKVPKWAEKAAGKEPELTCPQRLAKTNETIEALKERISEGQETEEILATIVKDVIECFKDEELKIFANEALTEVREDTKGFYYKNEAKKAIERLSLVQGVINEGNTDNKRELQPVPADEGKPEATDR